MRLFWGRTGVWLVFAAAATLAGAQGQEDFHGVKVRELHPVATPTPFPLDARTGRVETLDYLAPEAMSAADAALVAANSAEIARRAALAGFRLRADGGWGYEQAVCPAFPEHVVLEYSRSNGAGDVSLFSVVIPRATAGDHLRVIPVRRRSYSLWTPVASNALTLHDFNAMVKRDGLNPDWLTTGLCYAALAGGHVRAALQAMSPAEERYPMYEAALLTVSDKGGAQVLFADVSGRAMNWKLIFAQDGRLLKVAHSDADGLVEKTVPGAAVEAHGTAVVGSAVEVGGPGK